MSVIEMDTKQIMCDSKKIYGLLLMMLFPIFSMFIFTSCHSDKINEQSDRLLSGTDTLIKVSNTDTLPKILQGIPLGIKVYHDPDTIYAVRFEKDTSKYVWKHTTTVISENEDVQILEFGTYNYKDGKWVLGNLTKKPYTSDYFQKWYFIKSQSDMLSWVNCKGGKLLKGVEYIDPTNWSVTNKNLVERHGLWYYIGVNNRGEKVAGYARYTVLPELLDSVR